VGGVGDTVQLRYCLVRASQYATALVWVIFNRVGDHLAGVSLFDA
jgi:hypothetical protein